MTTLDDLAETLNKIELKQEYFMREVETIKRGIYGDSANQVKGLIHTDQDQDKRIRSLEDTKSKIYWTGGGLLVSGELIWQFIKNKFL